MLTDNVLAFGTLNPRENFLNNNGSSSINVDTKKVRNGQVHFGINLTFGRDKKEKPIDEADENRANAVSSGEDKAGESTTTPTSNKKAKGGSSTRTVLPTGKTTTSTPNRTDYNSKGNSNQKSKSDKSKKSSSKSDYNSKSDKKKKKKKTRKGELKTKVKESSPKGSTLRKVSRKL